MDILTVISIVVLLFVGFYDFFVNKLKFIKKSSPDKNQKSLSRSLILFSILYAPLRLYFKLLLIVIIDFFTHYKVVDYPRITNRRFVDIDYYLKFFDFSNRFADSLINNYLIFTVIYVLISIWLYRTRQKKKLFFDAIDILKLYHTKKNLARGILLAIAIIVTKPIIHYLLCYDCGDSAPLKSYYSIIFTSDIEWLDSTINLFHSLNCLNSLLKLHL